MATAVHIIVLPNLECSVVSSSRVRVTVTEGIATCFLRLIPYYNALKYVYLGANIVIFSVPNQGFKNSFFLVCMILTNRDAFSRVTMRLNSTYYHKDSQLMENVGSGVGKQFWVFFWMLV